jgi:His-Xaa-Ser system protein HxsD
VSSVLRAAYKFTDRWHLFLTRTAEAPGDILAVFTPKSPDGRIENSLMGEFANELLDQRLRETLEQEFGPLRTMIVAQAFAEGNLLDTDRDDGDYRSDPRGAGRRR